MSRTKWHKPVTVRKWLLLAVCFGALFLVSSLVYGTGILNSPTLLVERWIIGRPSTQFDCVLLQWRSFGTAPVTLAFLILVGAIGALTRRYRWRILIYLLLLLLFSVIVEEAGKKLIGVAFPVDMRSGMTTLACPQREDSLRFRLPLVLGMWWKAPMPDAQQQDWAHTVSQMPIILNFSDVTYNNGFPSGHAIRWWFTGIVLAWLCWRHIKSTVGRWLGSWLILLICFLGASIQFYVGAHFLSDIIAGYLLGTAIGCLAIALFILNDNRQPTEQILSSSSEKTEDQSGKTAIVVVPDESSQLDQIARSYPNEPQNAL